MRIFLSAVSAQFKLCRDALASDLRAIGCEVKVQEDFQQGAGSLIAQIESYVSQCDRVIAIVGNAYGADASSDAVPSSNPKRSYTQWEYFFAIGERLHGPPAAMKDSYVYFASENYLDHHRVEQSEGEKSLQQSFVEFIKKSGKHRANFDNLDQLCRLVLRDGWQMSERPSVPRSPFELPKRALAGKLFGRKIVLKELEKRLRNRENTDVWGPAGMGKTALAGEALFNILGNDPANYTKSPYPDGIVVLDLYSLKFDSADSAWNHLVNAFDPSTPQNNLSAQDRARIACRGRRALVVVEGAEEAKDGASLQNLLSVLSPETVRLVLTRNKIQASTVKPLNLEAQLDRDDALDLIREIWRGHRDEAIVSHLFERFGGHPLALTWAAHGLNAGEESPKAFMQALNSEQLPRITEPGYETHTLAWLFKRSVKHLSDTAKRVLAAAGMLAQLPFPLSMAIAILDDESSAREALKHLVRYGLLRLSGGAEEQWEFSHNVGYQLAQSDSNHTLFAPLESWVVNTFHNAVEVAKSQGTFGLTVNSLEHASSLLRQDKYASKLSALSQKLRYEGYQKLQMLGRLDLVRTLINSDSAWLRCASAEQLNDIKWLREIFVNTVLLAELERLIGNFDLAHSILEKNLFDRKKLAQDHPDEIILKRDVFYCLTKLGQLELIRKNEASAKVVFQEGFELATKLAEGGLGDYRTQRDLSISYVNLGDVEDALGDFASAREWHQKALEIRSSLANHYPKDDMRQRDLSVSYNKLGDIEFNDNRLGIAWDMFQKSIEISLRFLEDNSSNTFFTRDIAVTFEKQGKIRARLGDSGGAIYLLKSGLEFAEKLVELEPTNQVWQDDLSRIKDQIAELNS